MIVDFFIILRLYKVYHSLLSETAAGTSTAKTSSAETSATAETAAEAASKAAAYDYTPAARPAKAVVIGMFLTGESVIAIRATIGIFTHYITVATLNDA